MPSTYSSLKIQLMEQGENNNQWGNITNTNLGTAIEEAIVGSADVSFVSGNVTLTLTDVNTTQPARNLRLNLSGATAARELVVPSIEKFYVINNGNAYAITVKTSLGTGIVVPAGKTSIVYVDATDVVDAVTHLTSLTLASSLPVTSGGTGTTTSTGTGSVVLNNTPTLIAPLLGTPTSGVLTNATGLPISTGVSGLGAGVATFLATPSSSNLAAAVTDETGSGALVFGTSPTITSASLVTPALGTPASGVMTNVTGLPISTGVSGLGAGVATFLGTPSSSNLAAAVTDETGTGALVFATSPTLVTPALGTPASGVLTNATGLPIIAGTTGTLSVARGGTGVTSLTSNGVLYGGATVGATAEGATGQVLVGNTGGAPSWGAATGVAVTSISFGSTGLTPSTATQGVVTVAGTLAVANGGTGVTTSTGTGSVVLSTSPTLVTPALGTPSSATLTNATGLPISTGVSGLGTGVATFLGTPSSANLAAAVTDETGSGALVFATSPTLVTPALGTPSSATLTNATGLPISTGVSGLGAGVATFLATPSSANLAAAVTDETGSGALVFANTPTLVTPVLGAASATSLALAAGLVATPALTFTGDLNTGMWSPAADTIAWSTAGTERMRVTSAGNVGIGDTTPYSKLVVSGTAANAAFTCLSLVNNTPYGVGAGLPTARLTFNHNFGTASAAGEMAYIDGGNTDEATSNDGYLTIGTRRSGTLTEAVRVLSSGNVGIGTVAPGAKLDVVTGTNSLAQQWQGAGTNFNLRLTSGNGATADSASYRIALDYLSGTATNGFIDFYRGSGGADGYLTFGTAGTEKMRVTGTGNVGIGTTDPRTKLTITDGGSPYSTYTGLMLDIRRNVSNGAADGNTSIRLSNNSNTFDIKYGGTTDRLSFVAGGAAEVVTFLNNGNVGIGTVLPDAALSIFKSVTYTTIDTYPQLIVGNVAGANGKRLNIGYDDTANVGMIQTLNRGIDVTNLSLQRYGGNVGIGTSSPSTLLHLYAAAGTSTAILTLTNSTAASASNIVRQQFFAANTFGGIEAVASITALNPNAAGNNGGALYFSTSANGTATAPTEKMRITSTGNVGIGTTDPQTKLHVLDTVQSTRGATLFLQNDGVLDGSETAIYMGYGSGETLPNAGNLRLRQIGNPSGAFGADFSIEQRTGASSYVANFFIQRTTGNVGIGTTSPSSFTGYTSLTVNNATNGGLVECTNGTRTIRMQSQASDSALMGTTTNHTLGLMAAGVERVTVGTTGNVGIGTTSPSVKLDVVGSATFNVGTGSATTLTVGSSGGNPGSQFRMLGYTNSFKNWQIDVGITGSNFNITPSSVDGGTTFTSPALCIDRLSNVGIGTTSPQAKLHVQGAGQINKNSGRIDLSVIDTGIGSDNGYWEWTLNGGLGANTFGLLTRTDGGSFGQEAMRFTRSGTTISSVAFANGSVGIGTTGQFGTGTGVIGLANATTNPSTNPTGGGVLYADAGALKWRGSSGTVTTIANA